VRRLVASAMFDFGLDVQIKGGSNEACHEAVMVRANPFIDDAR
jgi:hypothetical protein